MIYKVIIEDVYGNKNDLLSTSDKQLAEATRQVANRLLKPTPYKSHAIISLKYAEENDERHTWWYDDNFSYNFMRDIWEMLSVLYKLDVENC